MTAAPSETHEAALSDERLAALVHTQRATAKMLRVGAPIGDISWVEHMEAVADALELLARRTLPSAGEVVAWQGVFAEIDGRVILTGIYDPEGKPLILQGGKSAAASVKEISDELVVHDLALRLRHDADMRAIKMWQDAHPGNDLVWPNHADMVLWLLETYASPPDQSRVERLETVEVAAKNAYDILCAGTPPHSARESNARRALRQALHGDRS